MRNVCGGRRFWIFFHVMLVSLLSSVPLQGGSASFEKIYEALQLLDKSPSGQRLIQRAKLHWNITELSQLVSVFKWGETSRTDAVLTRHFDPLSGKERRERRVTIYIRENQLLEEIVFDIAHELTHATAEQGWDPYDPELTAAKYIWIAIESQGGEVEALKNECEVSLELARSHSVKNARCKRYMDGSESQVVMDSIRKDFYRVGKWDAQVRGHLGNEILKFPFLSSDKPELYSSTGQAPYPVALIREYQEITQAACSNSRKRLESLNPGFSSQAAPVRDSVSRFLSSRCQSDQPAI